MLVNFGIIFGTIFGTQTGGIFGTNFGSLGPQFWYRVGPLFEHTKVAFCEVDCHQFRKEIALARTD